MSSRPSRATWIYLDEAEEIFGGPLPADAGIISHQCASDGLVVFERSSVERAATMAPELQQPRGEFE
jgi:hypothetical protein